MSVLGILGVVVTHANGHSNIGGKVELSYRGELARAMAGREGLVDQRVARRRLGPRRATA